MRAGVRSGLVAVVVLGCPAPVAGDASVERDDQCREAVTGRVMAVPPDLLDRAELHLGVALDDIGSPTRAQLDTYRAGLAAFSEDPEDTFTGEGDIVCTVVLVETTSSARQPALLMYGYQERRVDPCFGGPGMCGPIETYLVDCARLHDATSGRPLSDHMCWPSWYDRDDG